MVSKTKIAIVAAIAAFGIASPAFADSFIPRLPAYSLPSEAPNYGAAQNVQGRALYNSAGNTAGSRNWGNDAQWSGSNR